MKYLYLVLLFVSATQVFANPRTDRDGTGQGGNGSRILAPDTTQIGVGANRAL